MTRSRPELAAPPPRRSDGSREERREAQRQKILECARQVFFRDGFMEANLDEVARLAEVAKGTLYRYFENKADLYVAVLSDNGEVFERRMREALASPGSPPDRLRRLGRFYLDHWSRNREYFEIFWAIENQPVIGELPDAVEAEVTRLWKECLQILADLIESGVVSGHFRSCDPWTVANLLWTASNGLIRSDQVGLRRGDQVGLRRGELAPAFSEMVEIFVRGLEADPG